MTDPTTIIDVTTDIGGVYVKRADVERGPLQFTITDVVRETFEARNGQPAQRRVVLISADNPPRKFSCIPTNLKILAAAWSKEASRIWVGKTMEIYLDPTVVNRGSVVGGLRVRIPQPAPAPPAPAADIRNLEAQIQQLKAQLSAVVPPPDDDDISATMQSLEEV